MTMVAEKQSALKGPELAAVFLLGLGEQAAAEVLRQLGPKEVHRVGAAMVAMKEVSRGQIEWALNSFANAAGEQTAIGLGARDYVRKVMVKALGEERGRGIISRVLQGRDSRGVESLKWMSAEAVAAIVRGEHPQIVAIILASLESDHAAEVLMQLPEQMRADVVLRVARLDAVHPSALAELDEMLEKQFSLESNSQTAQVGGLKTAAAILNFVDPEAENNIVSAIGEFDERIGDGIRDLMFVFDNILSIEDRGVQRLLREVTSDLLAVALKGADPLVRDKIFKNMSTRAADMLREDMDVRGPTRLSEVETAQKEILTIAARLAEEGELVLGNRGGEQLV